MPAYEADLAKFAELDAQVLGISQDTYFCHRAWQAKEIGWMHYPLASDYYPHGATVRAYGILREGPPLPGISERAVFVVDKEGVIVFSRLYESGWKLFRAAGPLSIWTAYAGRFRGWASAG